MKVSQGSLEETLGGTGEVGVKRPLEGVRGETLGEPSAQASHRPPGPPRVPSVPSFMHSIDHHLELLNILL